MLEILCVLADNLTMATDKPALRALALDARSKIDPTYAEKAGREVAKQLLSFIPIEAKHVAGYYAMRGEVNLEETLRLLMERGHVTALPVILADDEPLVFRRWHPGAALEPGRFGTHEPLAMAEPVIPEAVIVPLAAFDKTGHRLGYGAGFYDRTIARLRECKKTVMIIGAAFAAQEVEKIPHQPHDQKLDAVVTEKGILRFK